MTEADIRWKQRFDNFTKALSQLTDAATLQQQRPLSTLEKQGFIKAFELTHELAWNVMKDYFSYQGNTRIMGSRDATREAFRNTLVVEGDGWMDMIRIRNKAVHTYDESIVAEVIQQITAVYHPLFLAFENKMRGLSDDEQPDR